MLLISGCDPQTIISLCDLALRATPSAEPAQATVGSSKAEPVAFIDPDGGLHMLADGAAEFLREYPDFKLLYLLHPPATGEVTEEMRKAAISAFYESTGLSTYAERVTLAIEAALRAKPPTREYDAVGAVKQPDPFGCR